MNIKLFDKRYVYLEWSDVLEEKDCILAKTYQDLKDFVDTSEEDRFVKVNKGKVKPFTNLWSECDFCYYDPNLKVKKAWLEGKTIQKRVLNEWKDFTKSSCNIEWDAYDWRIKPTIKENEKYTMLCDNKYILNMYKNGCFNFSISKYCVNNPIYFGDKEKCMRVMNEVNGNFIHNNEKCVECNGLYCHKCEELKKFINDVKFTRRMTNREVAKWLAEGKGEVKVNDTLYPSCYYTYIIGSENIEVGQGTFIREWDSDEWKEPLIEMEQ